MTQPRLHILQSPEMTEVLTTEQREHGLTFTETVRRALVLYRMVMQATRRGDQIEMIQADGERYRLKLLF